jgi:hypothetical protein
MRGSMPLRGVRESSLGPPSDKTLENIAWPCLVATHPPPLFASVGRRMVRFSTSITAATTYQLDASTESGWLSLRAPLECGSD